MLRALILACLPISANACDVALALTIDVSSSVDGAEYRLQADGLADALNTPKIRDALLTADARLMVIQWSGANKQAVMIPWTRMSDIFAIQAFADKARSMPRAFFNSDTAPGDAIAFSIRQFADAPTCARRVIDVSGDGAENAGTETRSASAQAAALGIEINGIAIESIGLAITSFYYRAVITPNGFVLTARRHEDYPRAIAEKLFREVSKIAS
jgi:Ca-activated chloride channel family protein